VVGGHLTMISWLTTYFYYAASFPLVAGYLTMGK
jgi:hypothetical protein